MSLTTTSYFALYNQSFNFVIILITVSVFSLRMEGSGPGGVLSFTWRVCKWGSGLLKSRLCFLTSKNHKQDYKQRGTTTWG